MRWTRKGKTGNITNRIWSFGLTREWVNLGFWVFSNRDFFCTNELLTVGTRERTWNV